MSKEEIFISLYNNIKRSTSAYKLYLSNKTYYNAKHIYFANEKIYEYLNHLLSFNLSENLLIETINYLHHLENWFIQFDIEEIEIEDVSEIFVFDSYSDQVPFPKNYINLLKI